MSIQKIWAREILDSRGNPTVEVDLYTARGTAPAWAFSQPSCWVFPTRAWEASLIPSKDGVLGQALSSLDCEGLDPVVQRSQDSQVSVFEFSV